MEVLLYYRYVLPRWDEATISEMVALQEQLTREYRLSGRVRVANEGLNVNLSGNGKDLNAYQTALLGWRDGQLGAIDFKRAPTTPNLAFRGIKVWATTELCALGKDTELPPNAPGGRHVTPREFHEMLTEATNNLCSGGASPSSGSCSSRRSNVGTSEDATGGTRQLIIIDTRNLYESRIGRFVVDEKDAGDREQKECGIGSTVANGSQGQEARVEKRVQVLVPPTNTFRDFPAFVDGLEEAAGGSLKNTTVAMYCTGGVRCERASAYLLHRWGGAPETLNHGEVTDLPVASGAVKDGNRREIDHEGSTARGRSGGDIAASAGRGHGDERCAIGNRQKEQKRGGLEVVQLSGGIHRFLEEYPDGGGFWRGQNYVFDRREVHGPEGRAGESLGYCVVCDVPWASCESLCSLLLSCLPSARPPYSGCFPSLDE